MYRSLSKIAHQMWRDHASNKRNRITERTEGGVGIGGDREKKGGEDLTHFEKEGGRQYRVLHKIGG